MRKLRGNGERMRKQFKPFMRKPFPHFLSISSSFPHSLSISSSFPHSLSISSQPGSKSPAGCDTLARSVQRSCQEFAFSKPFNQLMICHSPLPLVIKSETRQQSLMVMMMIIFTEAGSFLRSQSRGYKST